MEESAVLLVGFKCFSNTYFHFKTKHVFRRHTTNCVGVLNAESLIFFFLPPLSSSSSVWTQLQFIWNVSVIFSLQCTSKLPVLWDSSVITLDRQYSACAELLIVRGEEKRFVAEVIYFTCLSLDSCGSCFTHSPWSMCSAGAQSVVLIKGPIQQNTLYCIQTVITPTAGECNTLKT